MTRRGEVGIGFEIVFLHKHSAHHKLKYAMVVKQETSERKTTEMLKRN